MNKKLIFLSLTTALVAIGALAQSSGGAAGGAGSGAGAAGSTPGSGTGTTPGTPGSPAVGTTPSVPPASTPQAGTPTIRTFPPGAAPNSPGTIVGTNQFGLGTNTIGVGSNMVGIGTNTIQTGSNQFGLNTNLLDTNALLFPTSRTNGTIQRFRQDLPPPAGGMTPPLPNGPGGNP